MQYGRFEGRITHIKGSKEFVEICKNLNNCIDHLEAFLREVSTAIVCSQEKKYYRRAIASGLDGTFGQNINGINEALHKIENNAKQSIKNTLSKSLMDLNLQSQNSNLEYIANNLNDDITFMKQVDNNIKEIQHYSESSKNDVETITNSINEL